ncbi:murein hydrolase activator EnvC family protein [Desulfonatronovibrio magnus]|uniref:murein hydrolase activator EnvC family protein n=1 Tax=Desulfonatronovibrio magnus TaxID=698827 RepID=UPI0005EAD5B5|nr:peptidoglycan DD-metalloendopeptidase family protein [Desulfonatronovibrio magnus]
MIKATSFQRIVLSLSLVLIFLCTGSTDMAAENIESQIEQRRQELLRQQRTVERLSQQERETYSRLARAEDRLDKLAHDVASHEKRLEELAEREQEIRNEYEALSSQRAETRDELSLMLQNIWPIFLESRGSSAADMLKWNELDRHISWLRAIYDAAREQYALLQTQSADVASSLVRLQSMQEEQKNQMQRTDAVRGQMLNEKLAYLNELQEIRAQRLAGEEVVNEIMQIIENLRFRLQAVEDREFPTLKGTLFPPAEGNTIASFNASADPPHNGLSIALMENAPVHSVSWGKVVHNGTLRGFGRVVIILHGNDYYSLYAYLADSHLQVGQDVEKGEQIGLAGYYPQINSHGIYFELRFKQKAINPDPWIAGR